MQQVNVLKTSVNFQTTLGSERFERFSEWIRLVESMSFLKQVAKYRTAAVTEDTRSKSVRSYKEAELFIIKVVQNEVYQTEIANIRQNLRLPKNSSLVSLNPFLDSRGVLCVGGRLNRANIELHEKNPIIIPGKHYIAKLLIRHFHCLSPGTPFYRRSHQKSRFLDNRSEAFNTVIHSLVR
ncbi:Hypothetical predicted protein [Mytilus galloprovincialis]|uniref:Uncharacterized protein n=1 Tax=Mytilus galloprovincialis TaxID=29158 RepID=A0A8B6DRQ9_MYTGA|nr:Hypothetical predicted protein [Mytilus galloprovincialis]